MQDKNKVKLLKDMENLLPIGIEDGGKLHKSIAFRRWGFAEELEIGEARDAEKAGNQAGHVGVVLAVMGTKFGSWDLPSLEMDARKARIKKMFLGDVQTAYLNLRCEVMGNVISVRGRCKCGNPIDDYKADIKTVEILTAASVEETRWNYPLKNTLKSRRSIEQLSFMPPRWFAIEEIPPSSGLFSAQSKWAMVRGSVCGMNGEVGNLPTDEELRMLTKVDIEGILAEMEDHHFGPRMIVEGPCPKCKGEFRIPLDWNFDSFFGTSSL